LRVMQNAGLFTDDISANKALFADVIQACAILKQTDKKSEKRDTISSLVSLYKLLDSKNSPLTLEAHNIIIDRLVASDYLARITEMIQLLGNLDAKQTEKLVSSAKYLIYIADVVKDFDAGNGSFIYAFNHLDAGYRLFRLCEDLKEARKHGPLDWLREKDFKVVIDHIGDDRFYEILRVLRDLNEVGVLKSCRDRYLQNISITPVLIQLGWRKLLTKENIDFAFANPDFMLAEKMCLSSGIIGARANFSLEDDDQLVQGLLANPELTRAFKTMKDMFEQNIQAGFNVSQNQFAEDLKALIKSARIGSEPDLARELSDLIKSGLSLFNVAFEPRNIAECLDVMKKKYDYKEPVVELERVGVPANKF